MTKNLTAGPGVIVRHANPELSGWEGVIQATNRTGRWISREADGAVFYRVAWYAGADGRGHEPQWVDATALVLLRAS